MTNREKIGKLAFKTTEFERGLVDAVWELNSPVKWPALNAVRHLNRAWKLRDVDNEMCAFRAITAEEEAATALIRSLQRQKYKNADRLIPRDHVHKAAVIPFWEAVTLVIASPAVVHPKLTMRLLTNPSRMALLFRFRDSEVWQQIIPPLDFDFSRSITGGEFKIEREFGEGIRQVVAQSGSASFLAQARTRANHRNLLLYAPPNGYPVVDHSMEPGLALAGRNVFTLFRMLLFVDPYPKQKFVQQLLDGLVLALDRVERES